MGQPGDKQQQTLLFVMCSKSTDVLHCLVVTCHQWLAPRHRKLSSPRAVVTVTSGRLHPPPSPTTGTTNDVAMPRHVLNECWPRRWRSMRREESLRCHVADCDMATQRQTTTNSSFVVFQVSPLPPLCFCSHTTTPFHISNIPTPRRPYDNNNPLT